MIKNSLAILLIIFVFNACATKYRKEGYSGGFSEQQYGERVWQVKFKGNGQTSSDRVDRYLMYRCAELTLEKGYFKFRLQSKEDNATVTNYVRHKGIAVITLYRENDDCPDCVEASFILKSTSVDK